MRVHNGPADGVGDLKQSETSLDLTVPFGKQWVLDYRGLYAPLTVQGLGSQASLDSLS
jgi:hypothetical protein